MPKNFLDSKGLQDYHNNVVKALNEKANKVHVGVSAPTESYIDTWFDTDEDQEAQVINLMSDYTDEEELTFNNDDEEELIFNDDGEELTFNEDI